MSRRGRGDGTVYFDDERGRWVGQLDLGFGPDGRRLRRTVVGRTKGDVAAKLRALRQQHEGRPGTVPGAQTIGELAERWITTAVAARHPEGSPRWDAYRYVIDRHIVPGIGSHQLRTVTADDVDRFLVERARRGYSSSVVRRTRNTLSQVFRWGGRRRVCTWDPAAFSELPPAGVFKEATARRRRVPRALDPDEGRRLVHALDGHPQRALVLTARCTGLRPGELRALHWEDVDLDAGLLTVRRAWKGRDDHRHLGEPKTANSVRTLNLPPAVLDAVRVLRDDRDDVERSRRRPDDWSELVTTAAGTPIDPFDYRRLIKELARVAGVGHLAPYDLRHTAASLGPCRTCQGAWHPLWHPRPVRVPSGEYRECPDLLRHKGFPEWS